jgi:hypothetical protein
MCRGRTGKEGKWVLKFALGWFCERDCIENRDGLRIKFAGDEIFDGNWLGRGITLYGPIDSK